jgi:multiple sugar transport system permease protein
MEGATTMGALLKRQSLDSGKWLTTIAMLIVGILMIVPFLWMLSSSFKTQAEIFDNPMQLIPQHFHLDNYKQVLHTPLFLRWYWNSFVIVILTIVLKSVVVTTVAYAFARLDFKGREPLFLLLLSSIMITPDTTGHCPVFAV